VPAGSWPRSARNACRVDVDRDARLRNVERHAFRAERGQEPSGTGAAVRPFDRHRERLPGLDPLREIEPLDLELRPRREVFDGVVRQPPTWLRALVPFPDDGGRRHLGDRHPDRDAVEVGAFVEPDRHDRCVPRVTGLDRKREVDGLL
jgi:hypothetical protein